MAPPVVAEVREVGNNMNDAQIDRLSEITGNLSLLFFATMVLPVFAGVTTTLVLLKGEKRKNGHTV